jgi:hypothetical protein
MMRPRGRLGGAYAPDAFATVCLPRAGLGAMLDTLGEALDYYRAVMGVEELDAWVSLIVQLRQAQQHPAGRGRAC